LVYSVRRVDDIIFRDELFARAAGDPNFSLYATVTRETPADARLRAGRVSAGLVGEVLARIGDKPRHVYVCGANAFVDVATRLLLDMGVPFAIIRTERYGGDPARQETGALPEV
jgi:ferredoxin-NADP reductase